MLFESIVKLTCAAVASSKVPAVKSRRIIAGFILL
jgi:hypothetical protein